MDKTTQRTILGMFMIAMIPVTVFGAIVMMTPHTYGNLSVIARHADGTIIAQFTVHNLFTNLGMNLVKTNFGVAGTKDTPLVIQLANATFTPSVSSTYCCGGSDLTFGSSDGLAPAAGTYTSTGTGTWTVVHTFTATVAVSVTIYGAALTTTVTTGGAAANNGAEATFTSSVTLTQVGDNIQTTWSMTAT